MRLLALCLLLRPLRRCALLHEVKDVPVPLAGRLAWLSAPRRLLLALGLLAPVAARLLPPGALLVYRPLKFLQEVI
ncbi:hypothetical protein SE86_01410 [Acidilobus sp. 7A]|nr:hypothetical protein SE86_01410 [Acidilobus sp. 7A]